MESCPNWLMLNINYQLHAPPLKTCLRSRITWQIHKYFLFCFSHQKYSSTKWFFFSNDIWLFESPCWYHLALKLILYSCYSSVKKLRINYYSIDSYYIRVFYNPKKNILYVNEWVHIFIPMELFLLIFIISLTWSA